MPADYPVRPVTTDEVPGFRAVFAHAFNSAPRGEAGVARWLERFEFGRSLAAFDGETIVSSAGAFSFAMRLPGAVAPVAGVTMVAVLPSHRRRGILTAMMRHQLADIHARGEAVAALFAAESGIYRRYGYGPAAGLATYRLREREGALSRDAPVDAELRLRLAEPQAALKELAAVYDREYEHRPGFFARSQVWWDAVLAEGSDEPGDAAVLRCVIAEDGDGPRGYALYRAKQAWQAETGLPDGSLEVTEIIATDPAATAALWGGLLNRDLVAEVRAGLRPLDDPLPHLLADPRRLRMNIADALWVRLVDIGAALALRRYSCAMDVVIEVTDEWCPHNAGRWRLTAGADGGPATGGRAADGAGADRPAASGPATDGLAATCERTTAPADLSVPEHVLGATYLGGTRLGALAAAGLVTEHTPGAVARLSAALAWEPAPWCPVIF